MGVLGQNAKLIVTWFSCVSEIGREPAYAYATLDLETLIGSHGRRANWTEARLFMKIADRGQQTSLFHTTRSGASRKPVLRWYASVGVHQGYSNGDIVRTELAPSTKGGAYTTTQLQIVSGALAHGDGHIPYERIVELQDGAIAMSTTVLETENCCKVCSAHCSAVLLSHDGGKTWTRSGKDKNSTMAGIAQFVQLKNGSLLAYGRMNEGYAPTNTDPGMSRSLSHDLGESWSYSYEPALCPLAYGRRHVFYRLHSGALIMLSFTSGSLITTRSGRQRRVSGLYAAVSDDEGDTFKVLKPLVAEDSPPRALPTEDGEVWHMSNATAEPKGYLTSRQTADGMIHVLSSRLSYHFTEEWLRTPPPDAPDAPQPPAPVISGIWYTRREDWKMRSATAKRTIVALRNTTWTSHSSGKGKFRSIRAGETWVIAQPPTNCTGTRTAEWELRCPCSRYKPAVLPEYKVTPTIQ